MEETTKKVKDKPKKEKGTPGAKKLPIDWDFVKERLALFVENVDIAAELGIHYTTLEQRCKEPFKKKTPELGGLGMTLSELRQQCRARTKKQLLATQIKMAMGTTIVTEKNDKGVAIKFKHVMPDVNMLIHLGKNFLDQSDKVKNEHSFAGFIIEDAQSTDGALPPMLDESQGELPPMLSDNE